MGWMRDLPDVRDFTTSSDEVAGMLNAVPAGELVCADAPSLNAREDLRPWCSPVEDQTTIGSCTAQAGVAIIEYYQRRAFGKHLDGSRLFVYKATRNLLGDDRRHRRLAAQRDGRADARSASRRSATGRTTSTKFDVEPPAFVYALGQAYQAEQFYRLDPAGTVPAALLESIKKHIAAGMPSMFGFTVYDSISQAQGSGKGRIPFPLASDRVAGGHAVAAVGYDDSIEIKHSGATAPTKGALIIRNSWGTELGRPRLRLPAVRVRAAAARGRLVGAGQGRVARPGPVQALVLAARRLGHDRGVDQPLDRRVVVGVDRARRAAAGASRAAVLQRERPQVGRQRARRLAQVVRASAARRTRSAAC